ncbi:MAG: signal peptidase [Beijerinckiaceae bacterium]|nr:MAG: signal peptidase [Beijerinckiaceae bacterium]
MSARSKLFARLPSIAAVMASWFLIDQISKWIILEQVMQPPRMINVTPFFNLTLNFNTGVSFGFFKETLADWPGVMTAAKGLIVVGLVVWAALTTNRIERIGLAMIAGGALGNAIDRWRQGAVTDFLDFHWANWHWPTFNMADVAIVVGAALMMLCAFIPSQGLSTTQGKLAPQPSRDP